MVCRESVIEFDPRTVMYVFAVQVGHLERIDHGVLRPGPQIHGLSGEVAFRIDRARCRLLVKVLLGLRKRAVVRSLIGRQRFAAAIGERQFDAVHRAMIDASRIDRRPFERARMRDVHLHAVRRLSRVR